MYVNILWQGQKPVRICWYILFQISISIGISILQSILCWKLASLLWPELQISNM